MIETNEQKFTTNLLKLLNSESKINFKNIAKQLNITRQTLFNKIERLRKDKVINDYSININPNILEFVILEIKTNPKEPILVDNLLKIPQLTMLDGILGEFSLIVLFNFKDSQEFNAVLKTIDNIMSDSHFKKYQIIETIKVYKTNGIKIEDFKLDKNYKLDEYDYTILKILKEEQGSKLISTYEIKNKIKDDISQSTIYNRIKKLEAGGIILNYAMNFSPHKIGFNGKFVVRIKPKDPSKYDNLAINLMKKEEISDLYRIGEQYGLFAIVRVKKVEDYALFIRNLYETEEIEDTFTNFVLDELKTYTNFVLY